MLLREFTEPTQLDEGINDPGLFKAVFMAGPPGAGKNHVISALGLNAAGLRLMDIDDTLYYLMKSRKTLEKLKTVTDDDYVGIRKVESSKLSLLRKSMLGLIINTTGREPERIRELKTELEQSGYDTFMVFVGVEHSVAAKRVIDRPKFATNPRDTRPVTKPYFDAAYRESIQAASYYAMLFGENFAYIDNNVLPNRDSNSSRPRGFSALATVQPVVEDDELVTEGPVEDFDSGLRVAGKKVSRFLRAPLTPTALSIIDSARGSRNNS